jgi:hypothetical protein
MGAARIMLTALNRVTDQDSTGPRGVLDQSSCRIRSVISPVPQNCRAAGTRVPDGWGVSGKESKYGSSFVGGLGQMYLMREPGRRSAEIDAGFGERDRSGRSKRGRKAGRLWGNLLF